jgi:hypothetical protein
MMSVWHKSHFINYDLLKNSLIENELK